MNHSSPEPIVRKISQFSDPAEVGISLQPVQNREVVLKVEAKSLEKMRKQATVQVVHPQGSTFEIICDEGPYLDGEDSAPPPLAYFSAGLAFCLLTQLTRYAKMKKLCINNIELSQETRFQMQGSVIRGTLAGKGLEVVTHVDIESDEPEEEIRKMLQVGENSCFAMQSVINPVPSTIEARLNGSRINLLDA